MRGWAEFQEQGLVAVLEQLRRYLERTVGLRVGGELWRRCAEVAKVRNCIAHHGGRLSKPSETLRQIIDADADLSLEQLADPPMLVIHPGYCERTLDLIQQLFAALAEADGQPEWEDSP
jgi:hypothetical protein